MSGYDRPDSVFSADEQSVAPAVLVVDPDSAAATRVRSAVTTRTEDASVTVVSTATAAREHLEDRTVDCVVSEQDLPDGTGLGLLETAREVRADLPFILHPGEGSETLASDALSAGVTEYVSKEREDAVERLADSVETVLGPCGTGSQLSDSEIEEFQTLVGGIADQAIFLLDAEGRVASWNRGARELLGYRRSEVVGDHVSTFYPPAATERDQPAALLDEARNRGRATGEGWQLTGDGERFWAETIVTALCSSDGTVRGFSVFTHDRTDQHDLREQHHLTERILDAVPVAVAVHSPEGELVRANSRAREMLEVLEGSDHEGVENPETTVYDADGEPVPGETFPTMQVLENGEPVTDREVALERADGSLLWLSVSAIPMYNRQGRLERVITAGQDITPLKQRTRELQRTSTELEATVEELEATTRELEATEKRFEALTENSPIAVVSIDEESTIRYANDTVEEIFGYPAAELVGAPLTKLMPDRLVPEHNVALERYLTEGTRTLDWEWIELPGEHRDGHEVPLGISFGETIVDGEHLFTGIMRDITEEQERQRELERRRQELNETVAELERSNTELEQFAYAVSHDMKEPLRMVSSYLDLLQRRYEGELGDDADEFIEYAVDGAERMQRMIDEILEYSRVGLDRKDRERVDCDAVVDEVLGMLRVEQTDAEIHTESLPMVLGNRTQLSKLFQNLLGNAISHSQGEVEIDVSAEQEGEMWRFEVADTGPGIPPDRQGRIFDLFTSVGESGGSGVGLAICRKVVEHHGGEITFDSTPGEGTTFSFTLPAAAGGRTDGRESDGDR